MNEVINLKKKFNNTSSKHQIRYRRHCSRSHSVTRRECCGNGKDKKSINQEYSNLVGGGKWSSCLSANLIDGKNYSSCLSANLITPEKSKIYTLPNLGGGGKWSSCLSANLIAPGKLKIYLLPNLGGGKKSKSCAFSNLGGGKKSKIRSFPNLGGGKKLKSCHLQVHYQLLIIFIFSPQKINLSHSHSVTRRERCGG